MADQEKTPQVGLSRPGSPYSDKECEDIIKKLEQMLDGEMDETREKKFMETVSGCEYCLEQFHIEKSIRRLIKTGFHNLSVSASLIKNIKQSIQNSRKHTE